MASLWDSWNLSHAFYEKRRGCQQFHCRAPRDLAAHNNMLEDSLSMLDNMIRYMEQSPRVDVIMVTDNDQALTLPPLPSSVCGLLVRVLVVLVLVNRTSSDHLFGNGFDCRHPCVSNTTATFSRDFIGTVQRQLAWFIHCQNSYSFDVTVVAATNPCSSPVLQLRKWISRSLTVLAVLGGIACVSIQGTATAAPFLLTSVLSGATYFCGRTLGANTKYVLSVNIVCSGNGPQLLTYTFLNCTSHTIRSVATANQNHM